MAVEKSALGEIAPNLPTERISYPPLPQHSRVEWAQVLPAAFLGLLIATLLSSVARGAFWLGILLAGFLAVYFYRRRRPFEQLTLKLGARLGALSGVLGFAIAAIASSTAIAISHSGGELHALTLKTLQERMSSNPDPRMQPFLDLYASRQGFILMMILGSIVIFLLFMVVSSIGGMLGAAILRKKNSI